MHNIWHFESHVSNRGGGSDHVDRDGYFSPMLPFSEIFRTDTGGWYRLALDFDFFFLFFNKEWV